MKNQTIFSPKSLALAALMGLLCLVSRSALAQGVPEASPYDHSRSSSFEYDPVTGLLSSETVEPDNAALCVKTSYLYDAYGNKRSATTANCEGATGNAIFASRTSTSTYASQTVAASDIVIPSGMFPTHVENAKIQGEDKHFDPRFGEVIKLIGPNTLPTTWTLDDFGRKIKELRADGTSTVMAYCYLSGRGLDTGSNSPNCPSPAASEIPADAISFAHSEPHNTADAKNGPFSRVYMDRGGRKIRTVTEAFDGSSQPGGTNRLIVQDTDYSNLGAPIVTTQPYFLDSGSPTSYAGSNDYGMTRTEYDALGRPTAVYTSDPLGSAGSIAFGTRGTRPAAVTRISYNALVTVTTNDKGQTRKEEKNVDGKVVRITDNLGAQIAHQHDAFGNLVKTKDALQNTVTIKYDTRGRKVEMNDPDTGTWKYDYNALGELNWQQSAKGAIVTMTYDVLGRMTQRIDPEYTSTWTYDKYAGGTACNKGVGKLCESTTTNGVNRKVVYDNLGRSINTRTTMTSGPSFATAVSYDAANGRPDSQTYPTGLKINYHYTAKGFLSMLTLGTPATIAPRPAKEGETAMPSMDVPAGTGLWLAQAYNAAGKAEMQTYGNNVSSFAIFDPTTGRIKQAYSGVSGATNVSNYSYEWDSLNHLVRRLDENGDPNNATGPVLDDYSYDGIGRLEGYTVSAAAIPNLQRTVTLQYNALGSILYKSDVGIYAYNVQNTPGLRPHALKSVTGAVTNSYDYDANGNLTTATSGSYRSISYTSFNLPDSQNGIQGPAGGAKYTWQYDENHQRVKEIRTNAQGTRTTWMLHPDNAGGLSFESETMGGITSNRHYLSVGGMSIGVLVSQGPLQAITGNQPPTISAITVVKAEFWHKDHLGSLVATTDHTGALTARYAYDPFGKRRSTNGNYDAVGNLVIDWNNTTNNGTDRGYTGHEHLDDVGLIHMNGRVFDPVLGMFLQGDPHIQDPGNLQNFNRYGYCYNNPMTCTDPTGEFFWMPFIYAVAAIWAAEKLDIIDARTARQLTAIAFTLASGVPTGIGEAATTGFISGAISTGNIKGALQGAFTAGAFFGAGNVIAGGNFFTGAGASTASAWGTGAGIALHGVVGCVTSVAGGGKCGAGALSAAFSHAMAPATGQLTGNNDVAGTLISAVVGGTASVLGGGKFANGAVTGAFSYLYNTASHKMKEHVYKDPNSLFKTHPDLFLNEKGVAQCVELVKQVFGLNSTSGMREGRPLSYGMVDSPPAGTAIATYESDGTYMAARDTGQHQAILLSIRPNGIWVIDQYKSLQATTGQIQRRFIPWTNPRNNSPSNNASRFSTSLWKDE